MQGGRLGQEGSKGEVRRAGSNDVPVMNFSTSMMIGFRVGAAPEDARGERDGERESEPDADEKPRAVGFGGLEDAGPEV